MYHSQSVTGGKESDLQPSTTVSPSVACSDFFTALTLGGPFTSRLVRPACSGRKMQEYWPERSSKSTSYSVLRPGSVSSFSTLSPFTQRWPTISVVL